MIVATVSCQQILSVKKKINKKKKNKKNNNNNIYKYIYIYIYIYIRGVNFNALTHVINLKTLTH